MPHDQMFPKWKHLIYRYGTTSSPSCGSFLVSSFRCSPPAERTSYKRIFDRVTEMCPVSLLVDGESRRIQNAQRRKEIARELLL